jgi:hypothetical protein
MKFITLTTIKGIRRRINFATVRHYDPRSGGGTIISYHDSQNWDIVKESADVIDRLLKGGEACET